MLPSATVQRMERGTSDKTRWSDGGGCSRGIGNTVPPWLLPHSVDLRRTTYSGCVSFRPTSPGTTDVPVSKQRDPSFSQTTILCLLLSSGHLFSFTFQQTRLIYLIFYRHSQLKIIPLARRPSPRTLVNLCYTVGYNEPSYQFRIDSILNLSYSELGYNICISVLNFGNPSWFCEVSNMSITVSS